MDTLLGEQPRKQGETKLMVLKAIKKYWLSHGYGPSIRELTVAVGLTANSTTVLHLRDLRAAGLIFFKNKVSRSIRLTTMKISFEGDEFTSNENG